MSSGSIGTNTSTIIHFKRPKKKKEPCNCNICINNYGKGCHLKIKPNLKGFCYKYKINYYAVTNEERTQIKGKRVITKAAAPKKVMKKTNLEMLSNILDTKLTKEMVQSCERSRRFGNGRFKIKCKDPDQLIVHIMDYGDRSGYYQIIE